MNKTPCLFVRKGGAATPEIEHGCEWVLAGEGVATHKWDGTCCLIKDGRIYARRTVKGNVLPPEGWIPYDKEQASLASVGKTHKRYGWMYAEESDSRAWFTPEVLETALTLPDGTYELCGPKIQKDIEGFGKPTLCRHGDVEYPDAPRTFEGLRDWLLARPEMEGLVFHHPDGRRCKIRGVDFGARRTARLLGTP